MYIYIYFSKNFVFCTYNHERSVFCMFDMIIMLLTFVDIALCVALCMIALWWYFSFDFFSIFLLFSHFINTFLHQVHFLHHFWVSSPGMVLYVFLIFHYHDENIAKNKGHRVEKKWKSIWACLSIEITLQSEWVCVSVLYCIDAVSSPTTTFYSSRS